MLIRTLSLGILLGISASAQAAERYILEFRITQGEDGIDWGRVHVTEKPHTWSKGLKRSYLRLTCDTSQGKNERLYSTSDHFDGLRVTHKLIKGKLELSVERTIVQERLTEIRALGKNQCKELVPVVTRITEKYLLPAQSGFEETRRFGETMNARFRIWSIQ